MKVTSRMALAAMLAALTLPLGAAAAGLTDVKGATTIQHMSRSAGGSSNAGIAARSGSGSSRGLKVVGDNSGFGCQTGQWAVQNGVVSCSVATASMVSAFTGKTVMVRTALVDGFVSGNMLRLEGDPRSMDIRVDLFDVSGALVKSCYLTVAGQPCHLGSAGSSLYQQGLTGDPRYATSGQAWHHADALVGQNMPFGGDRRGGPLQDNYIVSVAVSATDVTIDVAGLYYLDGRGGSKLMPVYSKGTLSQSALAGMTSGSTWSVPSGWSAPVVPGN